MRHKYAFSGSVLTGRYGFQQEARMASSLNHPHIVTVHDAGEVEGWQYLVTEYVDAGTLKTTVFTRESTERCLPVRNRNLRPIGKRQ